MYNRIRQWEPWLLPYIPQDGDIALDVGAAKGDWALDLSERFQMVMAFEPHAQAFRDLQARIADDAHPEAYVSLFNFAIADGVGQRPMFLHEHSDHTSFFEPEQLQALQSPETGEVFMARTVTLDSVIRDTGLENHKVDFVKIDTEGAEVLVLRGAEQLIKEHHPTFLIEVHSAENKEAIPNFFMAAGYDKLEVIPHPDTNQKYHGWFYAS